MRQMLRNLAQLLRRKIAFLCNHRDRHKACLMLAAASIIFVVKSEYVNSLIEMSTLNNKFS